MFEALKRIVTGTQAALPAAAESQDERVRVAACALLLELAHADGEFSADEQRRIEEALVRHFDLDATEASTLMTLAGTRRREATDLHQFTSVLTSAYDEGQLQTLAEVFWRVVLADGALSGHEDYLMRKLGSLLELRPGYLNAARAKAAPPPSE